MRTYIILSTLYFIYLNNVIDDPPVDFHKKEKKKKKMEKRIIYLLKITIFLSYLHNYIKLMQLLLLLETLK